MSLWQDGEFSAIQDRLDRLEEQLNRIERLLAAGERELFTKAQAARLLGVSRSRVLQPLIDAGLVKTVAKGSRSGIPRAEVERLAREGVPSASAFVRRRARAKTAKKTHFADYAKAIADGFNKGFGG